MAQYICLTCGQLEHQDEECCDHPDLFPVNDMPDEIVRLRRIVAQQERIIRCCHSNWIARLWWRLWCKHDFEHLRNLYGDQVWMAGYKRSLWMCRHCDKVEARDELHGE